MPNIFKKLNQGASNFFKKLPSEANNVVKKIDNGLNKGLGAIGSVTKQVSNGLEKVAPIASAIATGITGDPEIGMEIQNQASQLQGIGGQIGNSAKSLQGQNLSTKAISASNNIGTAIQGTQFQQKLNNGLTNALTNTQGGLAKTTNSLAQIHQNIAMASQ